jgi:hypothetical protein
MKIYFFIMLPILCSFNSYASHHEIKAKEQEAFELGQQFYQFMTTNPNSDQRAQKLNQYTAKLVEIAHQDIPQLTKADLAEFIIMRIKKNYEPILINSESKHTA